MSEIDTSTAAIAALMDGVTAGPWRVEHETTLIWGHCDKDDSTYRGMGYPVAECRISPVSSWAHGPDADAGETNARFIAAARELVPALTDERDAAVARAEQAEARVADVEAEVERMRTALGEEQDSADEMADVLSQCGDGLMFDVDRLQAALDQHDALREAALSSSPMPRDLRRALYLLALQLQMMPK